MDMVDVKRSCSSTSSLLDLRLRRTSVSAFAFILRMDGEFNITIRLLSERPPLLNDGDDELLSPEDMRHRPAPRWLRVADSFCPGIETPLDAHSSGTVRGIGGKGATRDMLTPKMRGLSFSPPKQRTQPLGCTPEYESHKGSSEKNRGPYFVKSRGPCHAVVSTTQLSESCGFVIIQSTNDNSLLSTRFHIDQHDTEMHDTSSW